MIPNQKMKKVHPYNTRGRQDSEPGASRERIAEMEAEKMDRAIRSLISSPEEAPLSAEQIAAFYNEEDRVVLHGSSKIEEVLDVRDAPVPAAQIAAANEAIDKAAKKIRQKPEVIEEDDSPLPPVQNVAMYDVTGDPKEDLNMNGGGGVLGQETQSTVSPGGSNEVRGEAKVNKYVYSCTVIIF